MKIIIVGGGSAGWMTAATLIRFFPQYNISLIESPNVPISGVGESTVGSFRKWFNVLGIDHRQFLKYTNGTYKLSIRFEDFYKKGESFHYPFGSVHTHNTKAGLNDWYFKKAFYPETPLSDYADCVFPQMALVNAETIFEESDDYLPFDFNKHVAFHFDALKFAEWLKDNYAKPRGVQHIIEHINTIEKDESGIRSLNNTHTADLFIDCTGFNSILLSKELEEPFESLEDILPNNSAWAVQIPYKDKRTQYKPYTNCTAIENGWVWNIPLWSRIGTGYVYSDKFVSDDQALEEFKRHLGVSEGQFRNIKMRTGIHKRLWVKNVVAIGLSAGFIEPLESNGLSSVHEFLMYLIRHLQRETFSQWDRDNFTADAKTWFYSFAEFVAMHYALSSRDDTPYWKALKEKEWEPRLISLEPFKVVGMYAEHINRTAHFNYDQSTGLHAIAAGMNWGPTDLPTILYHTGLSEDEFKRDCLPFIEEMETRKKIWATVAQTKQPIYDYLAKEIYGE